MGTLDQGGNPGKLGWTRSPEAFTIAFGPPACGVGGIVADHHAQSGNVTETGVPIWLEPVRGGYPDPVAFGLSGLEQLQAGLRGHGVRPPMSRLTGLLLAGAEEDHSVFTLPASEWFLSSQGQISAGALTMLADAALGTAVLIGLPAATPMTTSELSMSFLAPCAASGTLRATGRPIHMGRPLALSQVEVADDRGALVAYGTSTCFVQPPLEGFERPGELPIVVEDEEKTPDPYRRPARGTIVPWDEWRNMTGERLLTRQIQGEVDHPPIHYLTGMTLREVAHGSVTFTMPASRWLTSPMGTIQGGLTAMLAHAALATAVVSTLEAGSAYRPVDVKVNFLRPVFPGDGDLVAKGTVTHRGRNLAVAVADVFAIDGKKAATATGSTIILGARPGTE